MFFGKKQFLEPSKLNFKSITEAKKSIPNYVKNGSELIEEIYGIQEETV